MNADRNRAGMRRNRTIAGINDTGFEGTARDLVGPQLKGSQIGGQFRFGDENHAGILLGWLFCCICSGGGMYRMGCLFAIGSIVVIANLGSWILQDVLPRRCFAAHPSGSCSAAAIGSKGIY
eukprot:Plantae.Rhodophyta-Palmaria_palmata.ctg22735.p2 GENE.Plantae.Rhodophyta-Palmaria_palmata.ctg22735~~Plantae.Rhodophyta-Palmaria_palmata.ctg22735.p2  ORF type:complete len:122 (+),score=4.20 Plantae.Rhodophyta-Palmaria_palmata.ctg22735:82-447(+)